MMTGLDRLKTDHQRLFGEIVKLGAVLGPYRTPRVEDVWRRLQSVIATVRLEVLPHLRALEEVADILLTDLDQDRGLVRAIGLLREQLERSVADVTATEKELLDDGLTPQHMLESVQVVGAACALSTAALQLADELILPQLEALIGERDADTVADAMAAYERVLGEAS